MSSERKLLGIIALTALLLAPRPSAAQHDLADGLTWDLAARPGYHTLHRTDRDGSTAFSSDFRVRLQAGIRYEPASWLTLRARYAGRFSTDQDAFKFYVSDHVPLVDGMRHGESTIDELYADIRLANGSNLRIGRMQTKFELAGVARKSLDRSDSPNTDVTWSDAVYLSQQLSTQWMGHLIVQHNSANGPTNVMRPPLDCTHPRSRFTLFASLTEAGPSGIFAQRGVDITYIPDVLHNAETDVGPYRDYVALVGRTALHWPLGFAPGRFLVAGEFGYALNRPPKSYFQTGTDQMGDAGGTAFQISVNTMGLFHAHYFSVLYGRIEEGWLISPDLRNNNNELEARYIWRITAEYQFEARLRTRSDLYKPLSADRKRTDFDSYFRFTVRV